jgi:hypothetical protein
MKAMILSRLTVFIEQLLGVVLEPYRFVRVKLAPFSNDCVNNAYARELLADGLRLLIAYTATVCRKQDNHMASLSMKTLKTVEASLS